MNRSTPSDSPVARFQPCQGKDACRDNGERCVTCGRSLEEIAMDFGYDNVEEYAAYVARKLFKTVNHRREQASQP